MINILINGYACQVAFVSKDDEDLGEGNWGRFIPEKMLIVVDESLNEAMTKEVLVHELTHATLCVQGRYNQATFTHEEVCEFVGWCGGDILQTANDVMAHIRKEKRRIEGLREIADE